MEGNVADGEADERDGESGGSEDLFNDESDFEAPVLSLNYLTEGDGSFLATFGGCGAGRVRCFGTRHSVRLSQAAFIQITNHLIFKYCFGASVTCQLNECYVIYSIFCDDF